MSIRLSAISMCIASILAFSCQGVQAQTQIHTTFFAVNVAALNDILNNGQKNNPAIYSGYDTKTNAENYIIAPIDTSAGLPVPGKNITLTSTPGSNFSMANSIGCPTFCDITNLTNASFVAASTVRSQNILSVQSYILAFNTRYNGFVNALVLNRGILSTLIANNATTVYVCVSWSGSNVHCTYFGVDVNKAVIQQPIQSENALYYYTNAGIK